MCACPPLVLAGIDFGKTSPGVCYGVLSQVRLKCFTSKYTPHAFVFDRYLVYIIRRYRYITVRVTYNMMSTTKKVWRAANNEWREYHMFELPPDFVLLRSRWAMTKYRKRDVASAETYVAFSYSLIYIRRQQHSNSHKRL